MNRPVLIHGILLGAALVTAYFVWTRDTTTHEDEIPVLSLRGGLDRVVYSAPERTVELERKKDKQGHYAWIKAQTVEEKPAPTPPKPPAPATPDAGPGGQKPQASDATDGGAAADGRAKPDTVPPKPKMIKVTKHQEFKGNPSADELLKGLATLTAVRSLGTVEKDKLKSFGLEESKKTLTLVAGSSPRTFIIGGNTFGNRDLYIQDRQDKRVYVVRPRLLEDLQYAEFRLVDRDLYGFTSSDVERATVVAGKRRKVLSQQNRRTPTSAFWADAAEPTKKKDFYRNFMGKLLRLQAMEYLKPDEKKSGLVELLSVECQLAAGKQASFKLYEGGPPAIAPAKGQPMKDYYAVSTNSRSMVKINARLADEVARDIDALMKD